MKAFKYKFIRADKPPEQYYYPSPWFLGSPHEGKITLQRYCGNNANNRFLCGFKTMDRIIIGLFPLDAGPETNAKYIFPLQDEDQKEEVININNNKYILYYYHAIPSGVYSEPDYYKIKSKNDGQAISGDELHFYY